MIFNLFFAILFGTTLGAIIGMLLDINYSLKEDRIVRLLPMLNNTLNIILKVVFILMMFPAMAIALKYSGSFINYFSPAKGSGSENLAFFFLTIFRIGIFILIVLFFLGLKVPYIGKANEFEKRHTMLLARWGAVLGLLLFGLENLEYLKNYLTFIISEYKKVFRL